MYRSVNNQKYDRYKQITIKKPVLKLFIWYKYMDYLFSVVWEAGIKSRDSGWITIYGVL